MRDEPQDVFRQMDAIIARMLDEMTHGMMTGMPPGMSGYRVILRGGGMPQALRHDRIARDNDPQEPAPEVHRIGNEVKVVTALPGADEESIQLSVSDGTITIRADGQGRHFSTRASLPPVDASSMRSTFRNGVLEVTFTGLDDLSADEKSDA